MLKTKLPVYEYINFIGLGSIYDNYFLKYRPDLLEIDGKVLSKKEYIDLIEGHFKKIFNVLLEGSPVKIGGNLGTACVYMNPVKKYGQTFYQTKIYWKKDALKLRRRRTSDLKNIELVIHDPAKRSKFIDLFVSGTELFNLAGDQQYKYAKKISYE